MTNRSYICCMRRKVDRETIIEKGLELIHRSGYEATGVKEIADAAGMLKGSFYNYFDSKEDFAKVLIETYRDKVYSFTENTLSDKKSGPKQRLLSLFELQWKFCTTEEANYTGCFLGNCTQELGRTNPSLSLLLDQSMKKIKALYVSCVREGQDTGEISKDLDAESVCEFMLNSWQGVLLRAKTARSDEAFNSFKTHIFNMLLK